MLHLNIFYITTLISYFFWPFVRIVSFFSSAPVFSDKLINRKTKIILSLCISFLIAPFLPEIKISFFSSIGFILFLYQILIGITLGFIAQVLFVTANLAGEIIGLEIGLSFATFFDFYTHIGISIISRLFKIIVLFFFLSLNGHLYLIYILVNSFYNIPIDENILSANMLLIILKFSGYIFINSIMFVLPIIIFILVSNITMGIINRLSPQISIFSIGLPLNLLIGIFLLYFLINIIFPFFKIILNQLIIFMTNFFKIY
ncbi:flagellar biosynthetic protein FliR [Buchnera aphidicola]|uniref:flagellar biosynthetic protein FliR n=1 Tax=Buchnera aphidicola TaxID=9 RepID=UPI003BEED9D2